MDLKRRWGLGLVLALALVGAGIGVAMATDPSAQSEESEADDSADGADETVVGSDAERAAAAALEATGGGTVLEVEAGDDGAAFGVEIQLADGSQVEVLLDGSFVAIGRETDDD